jgi:hypothetical protein
VTAKLRPSPAGRFVWLSAFRTSRKASKAVYVLCLDVFSLSWNLLLNFLQELLQELQIRLNIGTLNETL